MDDGGETFDWNAAIREENRQKAVDRNARLTREEDERKAKAEALADRRRREFYQREVMREYAHAGVEPPIVDADRRTDRVAVFPDQHGLDDRGVRREENAG